MTTEIVAYSATEAAIADLTAKYKDVVFDVTAPPGMMQAKAAYKDINTHSITLEAARVKEKADSLSYGRKVDSEAKRIADQLDALRLPIKTMIETETKREERERQAAIKAAEDRILAEQAAAKAAEEKRMAEQRAEIARQQQELDRQQRERLAEELAAKRKIEEEQRASRAKIEAEERAARQAREAEEAKAKAIRDAEEARLKAERDRIDAEARALAEAKRKEQEAADAKARAEREAEEAKQRRIQNAKNDLLDGRTMLERFVMRFDRHPELLQVIDAAKRYLASPPLPNGQYYSKQADGRYMLCNADGTRSIFDDVDE